MFQRCDNKTTVKGRVVVGRRQSESGVVWAWYEACYEEPPGVANRNPFLGK